MKTKPPRKIEAEKPATTEAKEQENVDPIETEPEVKVGFKYSRCSVFQIFWVNCSNAHLSFLLHVQPEPQSPTPMETSGCEAGDPAELCQAFSDVILNTVIRDVDADDYDNPMLCSEYVKDIYKYLRQLEV